MTDETRTKLEALAKDERFRPLASLMERDRDGDGYLVVQPSEGEWIMGVEQCLGMLGSWAIECIYGAYDYGSSGDGVCITSVHTDRLTAAVECLAEAVNG
jgi:hypothetical protein